MYVASMHFGQHNCVHVRCIDAHSCVHVRRIDAHSCVHVRRIDAHSCVHVVGNAGGAYHKYV